MIWYLWLIWFFKQTIPTCYCSFTFLCHTSHYPRPGGCSTPPGAATFRAGQVEQWLWMLKSWMLLSTSATTQAPTVRKARMYKVLKEVAEDHQSGSKTETSVSDLHQETYESLMIYFPSVIDVIVVQCPINHECNDLRFYSFTLLLSPFSILSEASLSGRVRDNAAKGILAKQLQGLGASQPAFMNLSTGQIKSKKVPKEKSPEELMVAEMKKLQKKYFSWYLFNVYVPKENISYH